MQARMSPIRLKFANRLMKVVHLKNFRSRSVFHFYYLSAIFLFGNAGNVDASQNPGATEVRIPSYDENGRLYWELQAERVELLGEKRYRAKMPRLIMIENNRPVSEAYSESGTFDLENGTAHGVGKLLLDGDGFEAEGMQWAFNEMQKKGETRLQLTDNAKVAFADEVGTLLALGPGPPSHRGTSVTLNSSSRSSKRLRKFPTVAYAQKFELIDRGEGRHKFLLEGNVSIEMEYFESNQSQPRMATISCTRALLTLGRENNSSTDPIGKIEIIHAEENVRLRQPGRRCEAQELHWQADGGQVILKGRAVVADDEWGEAAGNHIVLHKEDGRAEIVGGENGRSRLRLPSMPAFSFPELKRTSK